MSGWGEVVYRETARKEDDKWARRLVISSLCSSPESPLSSNRKDSLEFKITLCFHIHVFQWLLLFDWWSFNWAVCLLVLLWLRALRVRSCVFFRRCSCGSVILISYGCAATEVLQVTIVSQGTQGCKYQNPQLTLSLWAISQKMSNFWQRVSESGKVFWGETFLVERASMYTRHKSLHVYKYNSCGHIQTPESETWVEMKEPGNYIQTEN